MGERLNPPPKRGRKLGLGLCGFKKVGDLNISSRELFTPRACCGLLRVLAERRWNVVVDVCGWSRGNNLVRTDEKSASRCVYLRTPLKVKGVDLAKCYLC